MSDVYKAFGKLLAVQKSMEELAVPPEEASLNQIYSDMTFVDVVASRILDKAAAVQARKQKRRMRLHQDAQRAWYEDHRH